jgi:hypothetical protein
MTRIIVFIASALFNASTAPSVACACRKVGDHFDWIRFTQRSSCPRYSSFYQQCSFGSHFRGIFGAPAFSTFSTLSATSGKSRGITPAALMSILLT